MERTAIIKLEAITISLKVLDQIEGHPWDQEMERWTIGWCYKDRRTMAIGQNLEGRYFKCYLDAYSRCNLTDIKNRFPQIFIK